MNTRITALVLSFFLLSLFSCEKERSLNSALTHGSWAVTLFMEGDANETDLFKNYEFNFDISGRVAAFNGNTTVFGTWSGGGDDNSQELILGFGTPPFDKLDEDWHVLEQNSKLLRLQRVSETSGGIDLLTFEKI